jgi:hypothetical protein
MPHSVNSNFLNSYPFPTIGRLGSCLIWPLSGPVVTRYGGGCHHSFVRGEDRKTINARWSYPAPHRAYNPIGNHVVIYAGLMGGCIVDDERVAPQPGRFYGGWVTADIVGPFEE